MAQPLDNVSRIRRSDTQRQQLPEEVASYVRELIISGAVRPGEFLRLEPIADAVGVSTTPVREGLLTLRSEGFVQLVPRRGFIVAPFTRQDVHDLFWAQAKLAGELAARAAKQITPAHISSLEAIADEFEQANRLGDKARIATLGHSFHREVNLAAHSDRLALLLGTVAKQLSNRFYASIEGQVASTRDDHRALLDALRAGDARKARSVMEGHILSGAEHLVASLERRGLWESEEQGPRAKEA
jgi:DNA-binding GntR family transcriptional regulator